VILLALPYLFSSAALLSLLTLTLLEIVLGIDNIIFISIVSGRLAKKDQQKARQAGLILALFARIIMLSGIKFLMGLNQPLVGMGTIHLSARDLILLFGGLFLIYKSVAEINEKMKGGSPHEVKMKAAASFVQTIFQIVLIDIVFSFDSILTAVGLVDHIEIMIAAVIVSMGIMLVFSGQIGDFVNKHPTVKMLALSFLVLIGIMLAAEAFGMELDKAYIYFAMAFALGVEMLNQRMHRNAKKHAATEKIQ
jgi:predicted tellurium resistance membrane protein TerC